MFVSVTCVLNVQGVMAAFIYDRLYLESVPGDWDCGKTLTSFIASVRHANIFSKHTLFNNSKYALVFFLPSAIDLDQHILIKF